jgi:hypothetical protein
MTLALTGFQKLNLHSYLPILSKTHNLITEHHQDLILKKSHRMTKLSHKISTLDIKITSVSTYPKQIISRQNYLDLVIIGLDNRV